MHTGNVGSRELRETAMTSSGSLRTFRVVVVSFAIRAAT